MSLTFLQDPRLLDIVIALLTGIVIAAVSSWITVQLSLRRFRSERWWERKVQAYERVIVALHDAKALADAILGRELQQRGEMEVRARSKAAQDEIVKAIDIGAFLLSSEALARLKQYKAEEDASDKQEDWVDAIAADWTAMDECLKDLIEIAKRDLKAK